jgi:hypothetical protein
MPQHDSIFPAFFLSGFECSTFCWKDRGRRELAAETQHWDWIRRITVSFGAWASLSAGRARPGRW